MLHSPFALSCERSESKIVTMRKWTVVGLLLIVSAAFAQNKNSGSTNTVLGKAPFYGGTDTEYDRMNFWTTIGSFKILGANEQPASGRIEFTFTGTVLVSDPSVEPVVTGNVRLEHDMKDAKRRVYHGTGKFVLDGKFKAIQWFGRDMKGYFKGWGVGRFYGEFDKDLRTGEIWYGSYYDYRVIWGTAGMERGVPMEEGARPTRAVKKSATATPSKPAAGAKSGG